MTKFKLSAFISLCIASLVGTACAAEFPVTVRDGLGRKVTVYKIPGKIVSTVPSNTEILYDLGLKDKVIAVTAHCGKTCDIAGKKVMGGWADLAALEKQIADLEPELVLAFGGLQAPLAKALDKLNITTFVFFPRTVDETLEQILQVGRLTGKRTEARVIVDKCQNNLKALEEKLKSILREKRLKCLRLMSTEAMVIGGTSFQNDFIKRAGGINIFEDIEESYPIVSLEDVKVKDPDIIIFNRDNEQEAIKWFLAQPGWNELRAAKEKRLISISCDYICHPNTRLDRTVEMLSRRFYPEKFTPAR
jgi:iron complex transport system substrate-binding protein